MTNQNSTKLSNKEIANSIHKMIKPILSSYWDGKETVLEMKNTNYKNWKQMEWIGFNFERIIEIHNKNFDGKITKSEKQYDNVKFDIECFGIIADLKTHVSNTKSKAIILNNQKETIEAIQDYGAMAIITLTGSATYDEDGSFKNFIEKLKGSTSKYVEQGLNIKRRSRKRKTSFTPEKLYIHFLTEDALQHCRICKQGKNSNGKPRNPKFKLSKLNNDNFEYYCFDL